MELDIGRILFNLGPMIIGFGLMHLQFIFSVNFASNIAKNYVFPLLSLIAFCIINYFADPCEDNQKLVLTNNILVLITGITFVCYIQCNLVLQTAQFVQFRDEFQNSITLLVSKTREHKTKITKRVIVRWNVGLFIFYVFANLTLFCTKVINLNIVACYKVNGDWQNILAMMLTMGLMIVAVIYETKRVKSSTEKRVDKFLDEENRFNKKQSTSNVDSFLNEDNNSNNNNNNNNKNKKIKRENGDGESIGLENVVL